MKKEARMRPEPERFADAPPDPRDPETVAEPTPRATLDPMPTPRLVELAATTACAEDDDDDFGGPFAAW
jgi:hypothetical protein